MQITPFINTNHVEPVVHHGPTDRAYYVSRIVDTDAVVVWGLSDPLGPNQRMDRSVVRLGPGAFNAPHPAPQKGSTTNLIEMTNTGTDIMKAVYRAGSLYVVTHDADDWSGMGRFITAIRLLRLNVATFSNPIPTINVRFEKNLTDGKPGHEAYYGWPAVEVNKNKASMDDRPPHGHLQYA